MQVERPIRWLNCKKSYEVVSGETGKAFTSKVNGQFAVEVTTPECVDTSDCVEIVEASLFDRHTNIQPRVFPNPGNGLYTLDLSDNSTTCQIKVVNLLGETIIAETLIRDQISTFEVPGPNGVYQLWISNENGSMTLPIMKQ